MHAWEEPNLKWIRSWLFNALGLVCSCCTGIPFYVIMDFRSEPLPGFTCHWTEECSRLQSCQKSSLCWGSEKWGYTDRRQQPVDPFAVTVEQHSAASVTQLFIPWLNLCWCIHKAGQKCSTSTHHSGNQSFLPSVFSHGLSPHCEVSLTSGSKHWQFFFLPFLHILPVYLNPSRQVVPSSLYSDTQTHLGC